MLTRNQHRAPAHCGENLDTRPLFPSMLPTVVQGVNQFSREDDGEEPDRNGLHVQSSLLNPFCVENLGLDDRNTVGDNLSESETDGEEEDESGHEDNRVAIHVSHALRDSVRLEHKRQVDGGRHKKRHN